MKNTRRRQRGGGLFDKLIRKSKKRFERLKSTKSTTSFSGKNRTNRTLPFFTSSFSFFTKKSDPPAPVVAQPPPAPVVAQPPTMVANPLLLQSPVQLKQQPGEQLEQQPGEQPGEQLDEQPGEQPEPQPAPQPQSDGTKTDGVKPRETNVNEIRPPKAVGGRRRVTRGRRRVKRRSKRRRNRNNCTPR